MNETQRRFLTVAGASVVTVAFALTILSVATLAIIPANATTSTRPDSTVTDILPGITSGLPGSTGTDDVLTPDNTTLAPGSSAPIITEYEGNITTVPDTSSDMSDMLEEEDGGGIVGAIIAIIVVIAIILIVVALIPKKRH